MFGFVMDGPPKSFKQFVSFPMPTSSHRDRRYSRQAIAGTVPFAEGFRDEYTWNEVRFHDPLRKGHSKLRKYWTLYEKYLKWTVYTALSVAGALLSIFVLERVGGCNNCFQKLRNDPFGETVHLLGYLAFAACVLVLAVIGLAKIARPLRR
jgi:hypothetical protein